MKIINRFIKFITIIYNNISLVDKYLIIFMAILFSQMIMVIFREKPVNDALSKTDIVIRTTLSSIFGYFLSTNFIKENNAENIEQSGTTTNEENVKIGFIQSDNTITSKMNLVDETTVQASSIPVNPTGKVNLYEKKEKDSNYYKHITQITIVAFIGIVCLLIITLTTDDIALNNMNALVALAQLRDMGCASIGFLLGYPSTTNKNT